MYIVHMECTNRQTHNQQLDVQKHVFHDGLDVTLDACPKHMMRITLLEISLLKSAEKTYIV